MPAAVVPDDDPIVWIQGEDLDMIFDATIGPPGTPGTPFDLTGYSFRMDIAQHIGDHPLYVFNSATIADTDPNTPGSQPDTTLEISDPSPTTGEFTISISRTLILPGGALYDLVAGTSGPPVLDFVFDLFWRNGSNKQQKILKGPIHIEKSVTLWT